VFRGIVRMSAEHLASGPGTTRSGLILDGGAGEPRLELLARAVILVAGMAIPEAAREAVLARVVAELSRREGQGATPRPG
jgi:hypothetical protein